MLGTILITWHFGLAVFGTYIVNLAKVSLIMLGIELLPGAFAQFRLQDDPEFVKASPTFFILFGLAAVALAALAMMTGIMNGGSWFILAYVFVLSLQRCLDIQIVARGAVSLLVSIPLVSNLLRASLLLILILVPVLPVNDTLWASLAAGTALSQAFLLIRRPEYWEVLTNSPPARSILYLWSLRREYTGYYVNSVLKRAKDTLFPLFCDAAIPGKTELGQLLVYTRSSETIAGQIRVLEMFLIHRETRANLASKRRKILLGSAAIGHVGVVVLSTILLWNHGVDLSSIYWAAVMGLFMYPYVLEMAKRSDAYAQGNPNAVTYSIMTYLLTLAGALIAAWAFGVFWTPVLIGAIVLAQTLSALVYVLRDRQRKKLRLI